MRSGNEKQGEPSEPQPQTMSHEGNKDTAIQCKDLGKAALSKGDYPKAIKMFEKSMRLYPVPGVPEMKARAEREMQAASERARAKARGESSSSRSEERV